jgi:hypothetical protein
MNRRHHNPGVKAASIQPDILHLTPSHNATTDLTQLLERGRFRATDVHTSGDAAGETVFGRRNRQWVTQSPLRGRAVQERVMTQGSRRRHDAAAAPLPKHFNR